MPWIVNIRDHAGGLEQAVDYIHDKWGSPRNRAFYRDCARHSSGARTGLPRFYLLLEGERIIGCYALLVNDLISRQDLWPWFACLYIEPDRRGARRSGMLMEHARREADGAGFPVMFLTTTHDGLYEKFGWARMEDGYNIDGERFRIYRIATGPLP